MMEIGWALVGYASTHDDTLPANVDVVFKEGRLKAPLEPRSLLTGRPYVYVMAGQKLPKKLLEASETVLLYDDHVGEGGYVSCFFASGVGSSARLETIQKQIGSLT
jgi:hypothetical protein